MTSKWLSTTDACRALEVSESTLRRRVKQGKIESKLEHGQRFYLVQNDEQVTSTVTELPLVEQLQRENERLQQEVEELKAALRQKEEDLRQERAAEEEAKQRSDTIILQLTQRLGEQQKLLEYKSEPFWRRWFKRKNRWEES